MTIDIKIKEALVTFYRDGVSGDYLDALNRAVTEISEMVHQKIELDKKVEETTQDSNKYLDLTDFPEEEKKEFIRMVMEGVAKELLKTYLSLGLKSHMSIMAINDGVEYVTQFMTVDHFKSLIKEEATGLIQNNPYGLNKIIKLVEEWTAAGQQQGFSEFLKLSIVAKNKQP